MRTPLIAGNWKMNTTVEEAIQLVKEIKQIAENISGVEKLVCPPYISLSAVRDALSGSQIKIGAQNMYYQDKGAFTGEISPLMLVGLCEYVILGHSERRQYFAEDGALLSKKLAAAIKHDLKPILCMGENLQQHEDGLTEKVVYDQFVSSLEGIDQISNLTIAYEPVWAIGTGRAATAQQAEETIAFIRSLVSKHYGMDVASSLRILYGGSVTPTNIAELIERPDIDGALVGGASLKAKDFSEIIKITSNIRGIYKEG